jgi:cysteine desulfurase
MENKFIYLDHSATTAVDPRVLNEMLPYFNEKYGNASSIYSLGRDSKKAIEDARDKVAIAIGAQRDEIYFTASGTEADNWAVRGFTKANASKGKHIITSVIEHPAFLETCKLLEKDGFEVSYIPVDENGFVLIDALKSAIRPDTILISIMFANNEIGTIQPIEEIGEIAKQNNIIFHTDAVQAVGSVPIDVKKLNIDMLSMSGHKFYGPKGVGVLYIKKGIKIQSYITGGHQERGKRAGTENVPGIVGIGKALEIAVSEMESNSQKITKLRDMTIKRIFEEIPYIRLNGDKVKRLPGNVNISFQYIEGESLLLMLDMKNIAASSGSACTSGSLDPSHVLLAIGLIHEIAHGSLRLSFGKENTEEDVDIVVNELKVIVQRLRDMSPLYENVNKGGANNV